MAGNVVVKINPDRPWIVVSATRPVTSLFTTTSFHLYLLYLPRSRAVNYVLTESEKTQDAYDVYDIVLSNLVIIVLYKICDPLNNFYKVYNFLSHLLKWSKYCALKKFSFLLLQITSHFYQNNIIFDGLNSVQTFPEQRRQFQRGI